MGEFDYVQLFWAKTHIRQFPSWISVGIKLLFKDWKTLRNFILLSIACVLILQLGIVKSGGDADSQLISMMTICAPWLCATFSAIFITDIFRFFAWEKISGLRTHNFVFGIFSAMLVPAFILALIFSVGMLGRPNYNFISTDIASHTLFFVKTLKEKLKKNVVSRRVLTENDIKIILPLVGTGSSLKEKNQQAWKERVEYTLSQLNDSLSDSNGYDLKDIFPRLNPVASATIRNSQRLEGFFHTLLAMTFICLVGCAIGLCAGAFFKKTTSATIFLVVLFIFFLMFGRLFSLPPKSLESISVIWSTGNQIDAYQTELILPWLMSFLSISRYAFNLVMAENCHWEVTFFFCLLISCLGLTIYRLSNKSRNWKMLSKR